MAQRFTGNDLLAVGCVRRRLVKCTVDIETVVLEAPLIYYYVCRQESGLNIFRIPANDSVSIVHYDREVNNWILLPDMREHSDCRSARLDLFHWYKSLQVR